MAYCIRHMQQTFGHQFHILTPLPYSENTVQPAMLLFRSLWWCRMYTRLANLISNTFNRENDTALNIRAVPSWFPTQSSSRQKNLPATSAPFSLYTLSYFHLTAFYILILLVSLWAYILRITIIILMLSIVIKMGMATLSI